MVSASPWKSEATRDIYLFEFARGGLIRFTNDGENGCPRWTPDGKHVTFWRRKAGVFDVISKAIDSGSEAMFMSQATGEIQSWSPDGKTLVFMRNTPETSLDLWMKSGDQAPRPWLVTPFRELLAAFSGDGKYVAYTSDESGQYEIYVRPPAKERSGRSRPRVARSHCGPRMDVSCFTATDQSG